MNTKQAVRQRIAAAFALIALLLAGAAMDVRNGAQATEPDYLVLNPENE